MKNNCTVEKYGEAGEVLEERNRYSFTMDYESKEIVMTTIIDDKKIQLRACEKDVDSMKRWFDLARAMDKQ